MGHYFTMHMFFRKVLIHFFVKGTSKSMEGFGANEIMNQAKREGIDIAVQWQDSDASFAKRIQFRIAK